MTTTIETCSETIREFLDEAANIIGGTTTETEPNWELGTTLLGRVLSKDYDHVAALLHEYRDERTDPAAFIKAIETEAPAWIAWELLFSVHDTLFTAEMLDLGVAYSDHRMKRYIEAGINTRALDAVLAE